MKHLFTYCFSVFLLFSISSWGQLRLSGRVIHKTTRQPIVGASIQMLNTNVGTTTDSTGKYVLNVPSTGFNLRASALGYYSKMRYFAPKKDTQYDFELVEEFKQLDEVMVRTRKEDANVSSIEMSTLKLDAKSLRRIPVVFGEADIIKALLLQPGVSTVGEGAAGFNVRGGRTDQNLVLLDEMPLFSTSHLLGFFTNVNPDVVQDVTLYKAGIPAQYGGRLSSLMNINLKNGNPDRVRYQVGAGNVSARIMADGPLGKKLTFMMGGRIAYPNWMIKRFPDRLKNSQAFFYDLNAKLRYQLSSNQQLTLSTYLNHDDFKFPDDTVYSWNAQAASLQWNAQLNPKFAVNAAAVYSNYSFQMEGIKEFYRFKFQSGITHKELKTNFIFTPSPAHKVEAGASMIRYDVAPGYRTRVDDESNINPRAVPNEQAYEYSAYLSEEWNPLSWLTLQGGMRYAAFELVGPRTVYQYEAGVPRAPETVTETKQFGSGESIQKYNGWEPRVSLRIGLSKKHSIKLSYNRTRQYLHLITNTTAISPADFWKLSDNYLPPQVADQYAAGYYLNLKDNAYEFSLEGYYKDISALLEAKNGAVLLLNTQLETAIINARGLAYGVEVSAKKNKGTFNGQINYTYARAFVQSLSPYPLEQINRGNWFPANYDKPHTLNIAATYNMARGWSMSANFTYNSGRPAIYPDGNYSVGGYPLINYSRRNADRIPDYHRLDWSLTKNTRQNKEQMRYSSWVFSLYNVYGRENPYSVYFARFNRITRAYQLAVFGSVVPAISWNYNF
jgi:hypothetical protein